MTKKRRKAPNESPLPPGKLPSPLLARLLKKYAKPGKGVVVGPSVGIDAAALNFHHHLLLAKTDPITFVSEDIGTYSVYINANDIAVMGGTPKWFLATILLPEGRATPSMARSIFRDLARSCRELDISLCGGHTEITPGIDRPIVIGQMLGEVARKDLITPTGAKIGDSIILTKAIAIEGTSILAREREKELKRVFSPRFVNYCKGLTRKPGISVLKDALTAVRYGKIHAMHDPTEGGLARGLHELGLTSKVGILIEAERIPIIPEFKALCDYFELHPLGVIASGALLIVADPREAERIRRGLNAVGIPANIIGRTTSRGHGIRIAEGSSQRPLPSFETDEIVRALAR